MKCKKRILLLALLLFSTVLIGGMNVQAKKKTKPKSLKKAKITLVKSSYTSVSYTHLDVYKRQV